MVYNESFKIQWWTLRVRRTKSISGKISVNFKERGLRENCINIIDNSEMRIEQDHILILETSDHVARFRLASVAIP